MGAPRVNLRASSLRRALKYPLCPKTGGQPFTVGPYCLEREATGFGVSPSLWVRTSKATPPFLCVEIWNSLKGLGNPKVGALVERCPPPTPPPPASQISFGKEILKLELWQRGGFYGLLLGWAHARGI